MELMEVEYKALVKTLDDCRKDLNSYLLLSTREVNRRAHLSLLSQKAHNVGTDSLITDDGVKTYNSLYEEACIVREKLRWALSDRPFYLQKLLRRSIIAVESVSQLKGLLGLKLFHGWEGKVKLCVIPPGVNLGVYGEMEEMKTFAREWGMKLEPNAASELLCGLTMMSRNESRALEELNVRLHLAMQLQGDNEEEYTEYAAEANLIRKRLWVYRSTKRAILSDLHLHMA